MTRLTRRGFAALGTAAFGAGLMPGLSLAQSAKQIRFSAVFSDQDIRAKMMSEFTAKAGAGFAFEGFFGGTLFQQGTELVALQRGNLEMANIAPQDISNQMPEWSVLTSGYLFRDAGHLHRFFASPLGGDFKAKAEDALDIKILGPTFYGTRQIGLRGKKKITTPADLAGVKLRMPGGEAWQFLGTALGANPTPMAYAEVYTGLQTGAIDGQDNPLPNVENMKFFEVTDQIVLTSHMVAFDLLVASKKFWNGLSAEEQAKVQAAADAAIQFSADAHIAREAELTEAMRARGIDVYTPDLEAFRAQVQAAYLASDLAASWPAGALEAISAL